MAEDRCYTVSVGRPDVLLCYRGSAPPGDREREYLAEIADALIALTADLPERCYARDRSSRMLLPCLEDPGHDPPHRTGTGRTWVDEDPPERRSSMTEQAPEGTDQSQGDGGTTVNTEGGDAVVQTGGESTTEAPSGDAQGDATE